MKKDFQVMVDVLFKFNSYMMIEGWFNLPGDSLADVDVEGCEYDYLKKTIDFDYLGVFKTLGPKLGFKVEVAYGELPHDWLGLSLKFTTKSGRVIRKRFSELSSDRLSCSPSLAIGKRFVDYLNDISSNGRRPRVLDIGGRNRSGVDRSLLFPNCDVVVLDILKGDNVDIVGDAHELSRFFPENHFDAVFSVSVFEHLLMPWKVAIEVNKVLKPMGIGIIFTHQSVGMHDLPWDFYRFSDTAWDGLFNVHTGFEIIDRCLDYNQFVLPFVLRQDKIDAEKSAGFEGSTVLFRKKGDTNLSWDVSVPSITKTMYPSVKENISEILKKGVIKIFG